MSSQAEPDWQEPLRRAARGGTQAGIETHAGAAPALLNAQTAGAVTSVVLAAFVCLAAQFRSELAAGQLDLIASVLRSAALAFVVRAVIDVVRSARALQADGAAKHATLALGEQGLYLRVGEREESARREEILGISAREGVASRTLPARPGPLLVTLRPRAGKPRVLDVPPYFAPTSEIALARLTRWWGAPTVRAAVGGADTSSDEAPEAHYERAARGQLAAEDVVIPEGRGYLLRAPYTALLGVSFALDMYVSAGASRAAIALPVLGAAALSLLALAVWFAWMARRRQSRKGIGMLFTRDELLLRGPHGVVAIPWGQLADTELKLVSRWSPFTGAYASRTLTLTTNTGERMLFDQGFLGVPLESLDALLRAYREPAPSAASESAAEAMPG